MMLTFQARRLVGAVSTGLACALLFWVTRALDNRLYPVARLTGLLLLVVVVALAAFNGRKKVPFLPAGRASSWLQFHVYAGLFSIFLFLAHAGVPAPSGGSELALWLLFWLVALSGILGLLFSRVLPKRLNQKGVQVTYELIPKLRAEIEAKANVFALSASEMTGMATVADFHAHKLAPFFQGSRNFWSHVLGLSYHTNKIFSSINGVKRYLGVEELAILGQLEQLVREKDELDHQHALQKVLKLWLFVHVPLTMGLLVIGAVHGALAWTFSGG